MLTRSLISFIQRNAPNWADDPVREMIDEVHYMIMAKPLSQNLVIDPATGTYPQITKEEDTELYELTGFSLGLDDTENDHDYDAMHVEAVSIHKDFNPSDIVSVRKTEGDRETAATITFKEGEESDVYVRYYRKPRRISSNLIQLQVPEQYHISHVAMGVLGLIEIAESGSSQKWEMFYNQKLPQLWYEMNKGQYDTSFFVQPKGY